jgi:hypothetical protein
VAAPDQLQHQLPNRGQPLAALTAELARTGERLVDTALMVVIGRERECVSQHGVVASGRFELL